MDISVTDFSSASYEKVANPARNRENGKNKKYESLHTVPGVRFEPFVVSQSGRFGPQTRELFDEVTAISQLSGQSLANFKHFWRCRIVLAFHLSAASGIRNKIEKSYKNDCFIRGRKQECHFDHDDYAYADAGSPVSVTAFD